MDSEEICHRIQLQPFIHQVGGRSSMLTLDDSTICKPLIARELAFYESIPDCLKSFVPEYRGLIDVSFEEDSNGYLTVMAHLPHKLNGTNDKGSYDILSATQQKNSAKKTEHRIRVNKQGGIEIECSAENGVQIFQDINQGKNCSGSLHNPWVLRCHREYFNKKIASSSNNHKHKFILLENLTASYRLPCILDLKMGVRQYDDEASLRKIQSQNAKVGATTSSTLGLRATGMQVYHFDSGHFLCHNKYYGRTLSDDGFRQTLHEFLHNGSWLRRDVIVAVIERLRQLRSVIQCLDTFRFFTSSLLIIYDGRVDTPPGGLGYDQECNNGNKKKGFERDGLFNGESSTVKAPQVDVRMIDFAHSTHSGLKSDKLCNTGCDEGYLYGLDNLIVQLNLVDKKFG